MPVMKPHLKERNEKIYKLLREGVARKDIAETLNIDCSIITIVIQSHYPEFKNEMVVNGQAPPLTRLEKGIIRSEDDDGCWHWRNKNFMYMKVHGKFQNVKNLIYTMYKGERADDEVLYATCVDHSCINPDHLKAGTKKERRMYYGKKGYYDHKTAHKGVNHGKAKLTEEDVREIRRLYDEEGIMPKELGKMFSIRPAHANSITRRHTWKHLV